MRSKGRCYRRTHESRAKGGRRKKPNCLSVTDTVQFDGHELPGREHRVDAHVLNRGGGGVRSPADKLRGPWRHGVLCRLDKIPDESR